ncbi:MAG: tetratricopeptide repeat protein, partial [Planctomycetaceae bacterium]|nr:tetratricopeptide repeat protein [Planctomycetaceae bacterium]
MFRSFFRSLMTAALLTACLLASGFVAQAQIPLGAFNEAPSRHYLNYTLPSFYTGNFNDTLRFLQDDLRHATRIPLNNQGNFLWLDSLCYWALQGECHFQMAQYDEALRSFNTALQIYFGQPDWLRSIQVNQPGQAPRTPLAWGTSARPGSIGDFNPCRFQMSHEHVRVVPIGATKDIGLMTQNTLSPIRADHIIQCLALTIRRRTEILGSLSKYDSDTKRLAEVLATRPHVPNDFTGSWVDV